MSYASYWNNKLERVQFALEYLRRALNGESVALMINRLEQLETETAHNLVEAEQQDEESK